jgi:hypothetical protein
MRRQGRRFPPGLTPGRTPGLVLQETLEPACLSLAPQALALTIKDTPHRLPTLVTAVACLTATALALRFVTAGTIAERSRNFFSSA